MAKKSHSTLEADPPASLVRSDRNQDAAGIVEEDASERAGEQRTSDGREPTEAELSPARSPASGRNSGSAAGPAIAETNRDLGRINKELQVRIKELELELTLDTEEDEGAEADDGEASEESGTIIAVIKDLHGEIDAAHELKEALEADLAAMKGKLSEGQSVRAELEARGRLLEAKAILGDQLREDISFVEEERNETARRLDQVKTQLEQITEERDTLAEQQIIDDARVREARNNRVALEAKVLNLEETVEGMDRLHEELTHAKSDSQRLNENVQDLKGQVEAADVAKNALDLDVTTTRELVRDQNEHIDELKDSLATARAELANLHAKLDGQKIENVNLQEVNKRGEREIKTLIARVESVKEELDLNKKALRKIRVAAVRTTACVRERHS